MRKRPWTVWLAFLIAAGSVVIGHDRGHAQDARPTVREILVPFEDLNVLLEGQPRRVLLSREEYLELRDKAGASTQAAARRAATIVGADYQATISEGRAEIVGELQIDVPDEGLHAVGLDLTGVGLQSAMFEQTAAPIGLADDGRPTLFITGPGQRQLTLRLTAPMATTAAQQVLNVGLPTPAATRLRLTVPGNVEVKSGTAVVQRTVDEQANVTNLELLPVRGGMSLVMTLNNRLQRTERVVVARSVLVDELTVAYERLHASVSFAVLHQAVDLFRFALPAGFEVTNVASPLLARWEIVADGDRQVLEVHLREATTDNVVLHLSAVRTPAVLQDWTLPQLEPLDVAGHVAVVGLLVEDRLKAESLAATGLIPIDASVLVQALPPTLLAAEPGAPRVRPVAAWYAPQAAFGLTADFVQPPARLLVTSNLLLTLEERSQQVRGGFALLSEAERVFSFDFTAPAGWEIERVTSADGTALSFERHEAEAGAARIRVRLPQGVPAGQETSVYFQATSAPAGWLDPWTARRESFPVFAVSGAARDEGAVAVAVRDDVEVRPEELTGLVPLDENEKGKYGLADVATALAYRYEGQPYQATLALARLVPRTTARTYSFFRLSPAALDAHCELVFDVQEARTRQLTFALPDTTPADLYVTGLDGVAIKEYTAVTADGVRHWTVVLAEARQGRIRLAVDFQQSLPSAEPKDWSLPVVQAEGVDYQSGYVAVEGHAEFDVEITVHPRRVDVGELAESDYLPGRRLLGAFGFVGDAGAITLNIARRPGYGLPPALVERGEYVTLLAAEGTSQTAARFRLRAKAPFLEVKLPDGSTVWSADLDGQPVKPQRQDAGLLVSLPASAEGTLHDLRIVYQTPVHAVGLRGNVQVLAPRLLLRTGRDASGAEVPVADLVWHLHLPSGYRVVRSDGTVATSEIQSDDLAIKNVIGALYYLLGGVEPGYGLFRSDLRGGVDFRATKAPSTLAPAPQAGYGARYRDEVEGFNLDIVDESSSMDGAPKKDTAEDPFAAGEIPARDEARPMEPPMPAPAVMAGEPPADQPMAEPAAPAMGPGPGPGAGLGAGLGGGQGQPGGAPPAPVSGSGAAPGKQYWALEGVRSLQIDLDQTGDRLTFQSLGVDPVVDITMTNSRRFDALAVGLALAVLVLGIVWTNRPPRTKALFVVSVGLVATFIPLALGNPELTRVANMVFYAVSLLALYYLTVGAVRWVVGSFRRPAVGPAATAAVLLLLIGMTAKAQAQDPATDPSGKFVIQVVEPPRPVNVPADALIVPYDPESKTGIADAGKVLVPYDQFVELWNRAHPEERIETVPPPAPYALAGAAFTATLTGDEFLLVDGQIDLELYVDGFVAIPLPLAGGVLAKADLDGQPARLTIAQADPATVPPPAPPQPNEQAANTPPPAGPLVVLYASGKGRHRLDVTVRLRLDKRGGWRVAEGRLPAAAATALTLRVPEAGTEIRLSGVPDRVAYETDQAGTTIETALAASGAVGIQWRPKVAEGQIDRTLTAASTAVLNVQEDGLRLLWRINLEFRRGQREAFTFRVPAGYLVERVTGANVRGWQVQAEEATQKLDVTLLKPARDTETLAVHLWRSGAVGQADLVQFDAPTVVVEGASLDSGQLTVLRSPLLEVRTVTATGLARTDIPADTMNFEDAGQESPLGLRPYESYRFASMPFTLRLGAAPVAARTSAELQTLLKVSARQRSVETRVLLNVDARPVYQVRLAVPDDLELEQVTAPGAFEWAVLEQGGRRVLTIYLAAGQTGAAAVLVSGRLGAAGPVETLPLPRFELLDIDRQQGYVVVQVDPAFDVQAADLEGCETVPPARVEGWLNPEQRRLAQVNLFYRAAGYSGTLRLAARRPMVACSTYSNVRVTNRALEETILLDFTIREAGVREVVFLLPGWLREARISVPLLRQKTITPTADDEGAPVRVRLQLQDEVMQQLRVLVEHDRLLTPGAHDVPLPTVETGRTERRYVALESAGRGEVLIERQEGLDPLGRQQREWRAVADILGERLTQVYLVNPSAQNPRLSFTSKDREAVETAGARIGLAQTLLVLDDSGAYRASQVYRVDNATEQFLQIELPEGAELWTARVAGEAVKPSDAPAGGGLRRVRIPLLKTEAGDLDYEVVLKYGGRLAEPGALRSTSFPLMRVVNINVELSQVRLFLPERFRWFNFGGTLRQIEDEATLAAGFLSYRNKQAQRLVETLSGTSSFAKVRAANNLKQLKAESERSNVTVQQHGSNEELQQEIRDNASILRQADEQIVTLEKEVGQSAVDDNRGKLNSYFEGQQQGRSMNVVEELGVNFDAGTVVSTTETAPPDQTKGSGRFNDRWFAGNALDNSEAAQQNGQVSGFDVVNGRRGSVQAAPAPQKPAGKAQPRAPQVVQQQTQGELSADDDKSGMGGGGGFGRYGGRQAKPQQGEGDVVQKYQERLVEQTEQAQQQQPPADKMPAQAEGANAAGGMGPQLAPMQAGHQGAVPGTSSTTPTALASLDVELPQRGIEYRFTTPRGEVEITARAARVSFLEQLERTTIALAIVALAWGICRLLRRRPLSRSSHRGLAVLLIVAGVGSILAGILPVAGLLALIAGIVLLVRRRAAAHASPTTSESAAG